MNAATHATCNMGSEVEVTSCNKDKGKKTCFRQTAFMIDHMSAYNHKLLSWNWILKMIIQE